MPTKIAIIGAGSVGATVAYACLIRGVARHVVLYDVNAAKTRAEVLDLNHGLQFRGRELPPCKVSWQNEIRLRFAIKGAQPGQLRDMCGQVGLEVVAIRRIRIGKVSMAKMPVGAWRYLPVGEKF